MTLLAMSLLAPSRAEAGCSHLVSSRSDAMRLSSLIDPLIHDLTAPSEDGPAPPSPRPCSGALCSGQPAAPAAPAAALDAPLDSWAWDGPIPGRALAVGSPFLSAETGSVHPTRRATAVFHPPRLLASS